MNKPIALMGIALHLVACGGGDSSDGGEKKTAKPAASTSSDDLKNDPAENKACVVAGDKGNAEGVGAYCDKAARCGDGLLCTGDFDPRQSFCTKLCSTDADCGSGATCYHDTRGQACVPNACLTAPGK